MLRRGAVQRFFSPTIADLMLVEDCLRIIELYKEENPCFWDKIAKQVESFRRTGHCEPFGWEIVKYGVRVEGDFDSLHILSFKGSGQPLKFWK